MDGPLRRLRRRYEVCRLDEAALRVAPADQGLVAFDPAVGEADHGLVVQLELPGRHGLAQAPVDFQPIAHASAQRRGIELGLAPAQLLRPVHRGVGVPDQSLDVLPILGEKDRADAARERHLPPVQDDRAADGLVELAGDARHVLGLLYSRKQHGELVAPEAGHGVRRAHRGLQPPGHGAKARVPYRVPQGVVDHLEVVQVDEQEREGLPAALALDQRHPQAVEEQLAVGKLRESVVIREVTDPLVSSPLFGDVAEGADDLAQRPLGLQAGLRAHQHPGALSSARAAEAHDHVSHGPAPGDRGEHGIAARSERNALLPQRISLEIDRAVSEQALRGRSEESQRRRVRVNNPSVRVVKRHADAQSLDHPAQPGLAEAQLLAGPPRILEREGQASSARLGPDAPYPRVRDQPDAEGGAEAECRVEAEYCAHADYQGCSGAASDPLPDRPRRSGDPGAGRILRDFDL